MTATGRARLSWNDFQQKHRGRGWSKQEMSEQWKAYKATNAAPNTATSASALHGWLQMGQRKPQQDHSSSKDTASLHDAAADLHTPVKQHSKQCQQLPAAGAQPVLQTSLNASPTALTGSIGISISPITPSTCGSSQQQAPSRCSTGSPSIPAQELTALRSAVEHLLSGQPGLEQHLHSMLQPDGTCGKELQGLAAAQHQSTCHLGKTKQQQQQRLYPTDGPAVGCFGFASSGISWNGFQKACKGLGISKAELSAAWKHYKATGQLPGQLQQEYAPAVRQQNPQHWQQLQGKPAGPVKWAAVKDWVQRTSRASSRAVSRVVSRMVSPAATPQPSPGAKSPTTCQQQHEVVGPGDAAAPVESTADSSCSIGGCIPVAAVAVPAVHWLELDREEHNAQQQAILEQQLQEAEEELQQQQQQEFMRQSQGQQAVTNQQQQQQQQQQQFRHHSHGQQALIKQQPQQQQRWRWPSKAPLDTPTAQNSRIRPPASASGVAWSSRSAAAAAPQLRSRTVRELVDHSCPGLLDGFGPWMPVSLQPGRLKQLKTGIPARPGLYEWGVQMPVGTTAAAGAEAGGGVAATLQAVAVPGSSSSSSAGVRSRSGAGGLRWGQQAAEYGPVVCFYLGKAGTLSGARRLQQQRSARAASPPESIATAAAAIAGETLRTRFNKYALTKEGRLGPVREPHKDALFAQLQAAGGQLCYRWWVAKDVEPCDLERQLLECFDYAANVVNNGQRRHLLLHE